MYAEIKCRTVHSHQSVNDAGHGASCTLQTGLQCSGPKCQDYEISILCDCSKYYKQ